MVPGICVYPVRWQSERERTDDSQSDDRMVFNRPVAWRELEFRDVGNVLRNTFDH